MSDTGQPLRAATQRKASLRQARRAARAGLSGAVRADAARRVQAALRTVLPGRAGAAASGAGGDPATGPVTVAGYVPAGTEPGGPDLPAVMAGALPPGGRVLLPALCPDRSLDWVAYQPAADGEPAPLSPTDPPGPRLGVATIGAARLVVVPALAVDRRGVRLGRGGGSYDRALAYVSPEALVVALLHDGELLDDPLPVEPHDRRVSAVITPGLGLVTLV